MHGFNSWGKAKFSWHCHFKLSYFTGFSSAFSSPLKNLLKVNNSSDTGTFVTDEVPVQCTVARWYHLSCVHDPIFSISVISAVRTSPSESVWGGGGRVEQHLKSSSFPSRVGDMIFVNDMPHTGRVHLIEGGMEGRTEFKILIFHSRWVTWSPWSTCRSRTSLFGGGVSGASTSVSSPASVSR